LIGGIQYLLAVNDVVNKNDNVLFTKNLQFNEEIKKMCWMVEA